MKEKTVLESNQNVTLFSEILDDVSSHLMRRGICWLVISTQFKVRITWGCSSVHNMDDLHICEGIINAKRNLQVLEQPKGAFFLF